MPREWFEPVTPVSSGQNSHPDGAATATGNIRPRSSVSSRIGSFSHRPKFMWSWRNCLNSRIWTTGLNWTWYETTTYQTSIHHVMTLHCKIQKWSVDTNTQMRADTMKLLMCVKCRTRHVQLVLSYDEKTSEAKGQTGRLAHGTQVMSRTAALSMRQNTAKEERNKTWGKQKRLSKTDNSKNQT